MPDTSDMNHMFLKGIALFSFIFAVAFGVTGTANLYSGDNKLLSLTFIVTSHISAFILGISGHKLYNVTNHSSATPATPLLTHP